MRLIAPTFALIALLSSCQRETEVERARAERILLVGNSAEPKALDPQLVTGVIESNVITSLFEGLVADHPSEDDALPPGAALSWESNETLDRWVFHLRRDGEWSDGAPLTAHDFIFAYHRMLHPELAAPYAEMVYFLQNGEAYNKDQRGFILFGLDPDPPLPWEQLQAANFRGDPDTDISDLEDRKFADLNDGDRKRWLRSRGLDALPPEQLGWIAAAPADRFDWPDEVPAAVRDQVLETLGKHHGRDLWEKARVGVRAIDDFTLEVILREPVPFLPSMTRHYTWFPVPRHVVLQHGRIADRFTPWSQYPNLVGNGPFRLKDWRFHDYVEVERNPLYWDADAVWLKGIRFIPIENNYTEARAFLAGQLHTTHDLPSDLVDSMQQDYPQFLRMEPYVGTTFMRLNTTRPALDDPRVRQAMSLALDREAMCKHIQKGYKPATSLTPKMGVYQADPVLRFDPQAGRKLLAEAGYPDGKGFPRYSILISRPAARSTSEAIQAMWKQNLGILVDIENKDWGSYISAQQNLDFDIATAGWIGDYLDPTTFLGIWTEGNGNNNTGWHNDEFESLLAKAARTADPASRFEIMKSAEAMLMEAQPILPMTWYSLNYLHHPQVRGWHPLLLANHPWKHIHFTD
jgi:oligopeptide transport system substrate-binding protein